MGQQRFTFCALGSMLACLVLGGIAGSTPVEAAEDDRRVVNIGILYDGPPPDQEIISLERFLAAPEQIRRETIELTRRDFDVHFPKDKQLMGGWDLSRIREALNRLLEDPEVDLVLVLGVFGSNAACRLQDLPKPVVAPFAVDATAQTLPLAGNASGVRNLNYLIRRGNVLQDLTTFKERLADFERLHVLVDGLFVQSISELDGYVARLDDRLGTRATIVPVGDSADATLAALEGAEAVYVTPLMRMPAREFDRLVDGLIARRLPSFSLQGEIEVRRGVLAGLRRETNIRQLARRVALNIQRILLGEDAGILPVTLDQPERLIINMATARAIGFHPRWRVELEADLIEQPTAWGHPLSQHQPLRLADAVREAVTANLRLRRTTRDLEASREEIRRARSRYRPRLDLSLTGSQIDDDRASLLAPERTITGGLDANQVLFSDRLLAGIRISELRQAATEWDREVLLLDVAVEAAVAFLDVLRARTFERVADNNLTLTESNLELARKRESIGFSGPAEVYRWESELATDRSEVITAHAGSHSAFVLLNRLMHRPLEDFYRAEPPTLEDAELITGVGRLNPYIDNAAGYEIFREFCVEEGLRNSPELKSLEALIAARERDHRAARRSFWAPDISFFGSFSRDLSRDGVGESGSLPAPLASPDREDWVLGVGASLPLFSGGERRADLRQADAELTTLRLERENVAELVETRIRTALFALSASFPAIELARESATAATKNLELVTDAYSRGAVTIIELLDAQNAALVADAFASNAVYDFLIDLMQLQRATSDFDFFRSDVGRDAWFARLEAFFAESDDRRRPGR